MFSPIPANTRDGERMPRTPFTPSTIPPTKSDTLSLIHDAIDSMPSHNPETMFLPISMISGIPSENPFTIAVMISGILTINCGKCVIRLFASATINFRPVSIILGSISIMPSASVSTVVTAPSAISGKLPLMPVTRLFTISTAVLTN